jgi:hypothetical protein
MSGWTVIALAVLAFIAAAAGILAASIYALRFAGQAMNPQRPHRQRLVRAAGALICAGAVIAAAVAGFWAIEALMYVSMGPGAA